ncbi:MAG: shikimate dehydrogenase, partial [Steroidobacteraceae bacterium]|nr:shikimate dehydrogenase [Steroidobacteraceae bacterium]MDW8259923.1 shikimate dehydrogenase [Gammaproteobacteria bacterium]
DVHLRSVLICGAGGAARGVLAPLLALEPKIVLIANRTAPRAQQLAGMFGDLGVVRGCGLDDLPAEPFDLIINATSAGLSGELPPLDPRIIGPHTVCYDMSYGREATPFLRWAQAQGAQHCIKGWGMLVEQAAESFMLWRGVRPDTRAVIAILEEGR